MSQEEDMLRIRVSLVSGKVLAEVGLQAEDDVAVLEAEARRALGGSPCDLVLGSRLLLSGQTVASINLHDGAQVTALVNHKIVKSWNRELSYNLLEFSEGDKVVRRPKLVSANPAALVPVDPEVPTSLAFRIITLPSTRTILTAGIGQEAFRKFFGKGFGMEENSWGIQWKLEEEIRAETKQRPMVGDLICVTCDLTKGFATLALNGKVLKNFTVPRDASYVLGATLSTECTLSISSDDPFITC